LYGCIYVSSTVSVYTSEYFPNKYTKSFDEMKTLWEQIKVTRENVLNIPCVIIGTHLDNENVREIETFDA
jgi:hypothetical protein